MNWGLIIYLLVIYFAIITAFSDMQTAFYLLLVALVLTFCMKLDMWLHRRWVNRGKNEKVD